MGANRCPFFFNRHILPLSRNFGTNEVSRERYRSRATFARTNISSISHPLPALVDLHFFKDHQVEFRLVTIKWTLVAMGCPSGRSDTSVKWSIHENGLRVEYSRKWIWYRINSLSTSIIWDCSCRSFS